MCVLFKDPCIPSAPSPLPLNYIYMLPRKLDISVEELMAAV